MAAKKSRQSTWGTSNSRKRRDGSDSGSPNKPAEKKTRRQPTRKRKDKPAEDSDDQPNQALANPSTKIKAAATTASAATAPAASVASADSAAPPKRVTRPATVVGIASLIGKPLGSAPKISRKHIEVPEPEEVPKKKARARQATVGDTDIPLGYKARKITFNVKHYDPAKPKSKENCNIIFFYSPNPHYGGPWDFLGNLSTANSGTQSS
ncbi:hypothetical protein LTR17_019291 [Elasticomyces elasticus]|nr:hypothetical protein LTR17_019291 [Elasticomyces elasticus]